MKKIMVACLSAFAVLAAVAQEQGSAATAGAVKTEKKSAKVVNARSILRKEFEKYRKENNLPPYGAIDSRGRFYCTGEILVDANSSQVDFIDKRSIAYQKAYLDALANAVTNRVGHNMAEAVRNFSKDSSVINANEDPDKQLPILQQKIEALAEAEIDQKLRELNVDPKKFNANTIKQKRQLYCDTYISEAVKEAFGSSVGCLPVQTFETNDGKGNYAVGVILRFDISTIDIAECVAQNKRPLLNRKDLAQTVDKALPTEEQMITQFGVRLFFDESGTPTILSFGQKGTTYTGTDAYEADMDMEASLRLAEAEANSQLTFFINSTLSFREVSKSGSSRIKEEYVKMDNSKEERTLKNLIKKISASTVIKGNAEMKGRSVVYKEVLNHPAGHNVAVVVVQYSFKTADEVDAINSGVRPSDAKDETTAKPEDPGVRKGKSYDF